MQKEGYSEHNGDHDRTHCDGMPVDRRQRFAEIACQFRGGAVFAWCRNPEEVVDLADKDHQRDSAGEPGDNRRWDQIDDPAKVEQTDDQDHHTGHQARQPDTTHPLLMSNRDQHGRHRASRTTDLKRRATQHADQKATHDRRDQARRRGRPTRFPERKRQRQCHRRDRQPGDKIALEAKPGRSR